VITQRMILHRDCVEELKKNTVMMAKLTEEYKVTFVTLAEPHNKNVNYYENIVVIHYILLTKQQPFGDIFEAFPNTC
jgi:hypothetical protein